MNFLEQLYELNEEGYRVVELDRNTHYELTYVCDMDTPDAFIDEYKGDVERAIQTFYEKYIKMQS